MAQNDPPTSTTTQHSDAPGHPFRHAKDAAYTPLTSKNVGTKDKQEPLINKKQEPAYRTLPPIHDPLIAKTVSNNQWKLQSQLHKENYYPYPWKFDRSSGTVP